MQNKKIGFIGAGNMSRSIISGLVNNGFNPQGIMASNPSTPKLDSLASDLNIHTSQNNADVVSFADVIVLSVKPQLMSTVCADLISQANLSNKLIISIAAGITTPRLSEMLGGHNNIIRTMPNTPSAIGMGMTGLYCDNHISQADKDFAELTLGAVGKVLWVDKEDDINTVIAAAGSSPAYFFLFAQAMQDEVINMGIAKDDARLLVQQAMLGSAQLICDKPDLELSELRAQVTSKGGTTHEAIESFISQGLQDMVSQAMQAAVARATQMSKEF